MPIPGGGYLPDNLSSYVDPSISGAFFMGNSGVAQNNNDLISTLYGPTKTYDDGSAIEDMIARWNNGTAPGTSQPDFLGAGYNWNGSQVVADPSFTQARQFQNGEYTPYGASSPEDSWGARVNGIMSKLGQMPELQRQHALQGLQNSQYGQAVLQTMNGLLASNGGWGSYSSQAFKNNISTYGHAYSPQGPSAQFMGTPIRQSRWNGTNNPMVGGQTQQQTPQSSFTGGTASSTGNNNNTQYTTLGMRGFSGNTSNQQTTPLGQQPMMTTDTSQQSQGSIRPISSFLPINIGGY